MPSERRKDDPRLQPMPEARAVMALTACLQLVRPVGMSEPEADGWLAVAFERIREIPADLLRAACDHAQDTCTHHAQIVPAIKAFARDEWEFRKANPQRPVGVLMLSEVRKPEDRAFPALTQAEVDAITAERGRAMSVALDMGSIKRDAEGNFVPGKVKPA